MSAVPWEVFCSHDDGHVKFTDDWLLVVGNVVSMFRDGTQYCRLCDSVFDGLPAAHVADHEAELRAWRERQRSNGRPGDLELEARLAEALALVGRGVSQTKAASKAGISRRRLGNALQSGAGAAQEPVHARTRGLTRRGPGPPGNAVAPGAEGRAEGARRSSTPALHSEAEAA